MQHYKQTSIAHGSSYKLAAKYYGPYKVKDRIGKVAYQLDLPSDAQIHDTFHVSYLKKAHGSDWQLNPLSISVESFPRVELMAILERRMVKRGNRATTQLLV